jgi:hypothetical protein
MLVIPAREENVKYKRIMVQPGLEKARPYLQNNQSKKTGGAVRVAEHLPSKCKALSSNPVPLLEIFLRYWGVTRDRTQLRSQQARQNLLLQKGAPQTKSKNTQWGVHWSGVLSLMQCCPSPELDKFWVHSPCS